MEYLLNVDQKEIEKMVDDNKDIYWSNKRYKVIKDDIGQYLVTCQGGGTICLNGHFWGKETSDDFFEE